MKKYIIPEMDVVEFESEDIITSSDHSPCIDCLLENFCVLDGVCWMK